MKKAEAEKSNEKDVRQQGIDNSTEIRKKNPTKVTILGANEITAQKPWYILNIAMNMKVILNNKNLN